jgi:hypothetical protein
MPETIRLGSIELRFLRDKHDTGSLDLFEMDVLPEGRMPVAHYHRDWDETVRPGPRRHIHDRERAPHHRPRRLRLHPPLRRARL